MSRFTKQQTIQLLEGEAKMATNCLLATKAVLENPEKLTDEIRKELLGMIDSLFTITEVRKEVHDRNTSITFN